MADFDYQKMLRENSDAQGLQSVLDVTMEECAELIQAVSHYKRACGIGQKTSVGRQDALNNLCEEAAQVKCCIDSLSYMLDIASSIEEEYNTAVAKVHERYFEE